MPLAMANDFRQTQSPDCVQLTRLTGARAAGHDGGAVDQRSPDETHNRGPSHWERHCCFDGHWKSARA